MKVLTPGAILRFWAPLALTWVLMAAEGPFLTAWIARFPEVRENLAAYGIAYALAILAEAPVIMLLSAGTALVEDAASLARMNGFALRLNGAATALVALFVFPPLWGLVFERGLGLPGEISSRAWEALLLLVPWPAAIGYRRFLQGILIRADLGRRVALGTATRLSAMTGGALLLSRWTGLGGASVAAGALSIGVLAEAVAIRAMAGSTLRRLRQTPPENPDAVPDTRAILDFYLPLVLTAFIGFAAQPMLTFFMGRAPEPIESLAVFPVVAALSFLFRAPGLGYQETVLALVGKGMEGYAPLRRTGGWLAGAAAGGLALVVLTPLAGWWFGGVAGLDPALMGAAREAAVFLIPLPALTVLLSVQRGVLMAGKRTGPITRASLAEVLGIALTFAVLGWGLGWRGSTAAFAAFLGGRIAGNLSLAAPVRRVLSAR